MNNIIKLLSLGILMSFFTEIRFIDGIGIGEILILISLFILITKFIRIDKMHLSNNKLILITLYSFFILILVTNLYNALEADYSIYIRNMLAFTFSICISIVLVLLPKKEEYFFQILKQFTIYLWIYCLILSIYAILLQNIITIDIFHYSTTRLSGFSKNPNQLALLTLILPILTFSFVTKNKKFNIATFVIFFILVFEINSDGLNVAIITSFIFYLIIIISKKIKDMRLKIVYFVSLIVFILFYFNNIYNLIINLTENLNEKNDQATGRFVLWINGLKAFFESPYIGNGTAGQSGIYGPFLGAEAHNSIIDFLSMFGMIGLIILIPVLFFVFKNSIKYLPYSILVVQIFIFSMFHNILRYPLILIIILYLFFVNKYKKPLEQLPKNKSQNKKV